MPIRLYSLLACLLLQSFPVKAHAGREPSHHVGYLYNFLGQPWKIQYEARYIFKRLIMAGPDWLCGKDDIGSMSSWHPFSSMSIYSVATASSRYVIGSVDFDNAITNIDEGGMFSNETKNIPSSNKYIKSACRNGKSITQTRICDCEIMKGGIPEFEMEPGPNKSWRVKPQDSPCEQ